MTDDDLVRYIREKRSRYTGDVGEAIREELIAAGHRPEDVDAAFEVAGALASPSAESGSPGRPTTWSATLRRPTFWAALIGTGVFLFGVAPFVPVWIVTLIDPGASTRVRVTAAFITSLLGLAVAAWVARSGKADPAIARGAGAALALLLIPLVIWIAALGSCLLGPTR